MSAPLVVASWGGINSALLVTLAGYGGSAMALWLYGGAVGLTMLFAAGVAASVVHRPTRVRPRLMPNHGEVGILSAGGVLAIGLALTFGPWFYPIAVGFLFFAALGAFRDWRLTSRPATPGSRPVMGPRVAAQEAHMGDGRPPPGEVASRSGSGA